MADEPPDLDRRLVDAVERLGDAARVMLRRAAAGEGLSPTQAQLLLRITAAAEGTGVLAARLEVSAPTVSDAIHSLVRKGLAERGEPPEPRAWRATARGREVAQRLKHWRDPLQVALAEHPTEAKATTLASLLVAIADLNMSGHISTARTCPTCRFFRGDPYGAAWCALLRAPLAPSTLRVDCPDHRARVDTA
jgi:DNA-binding MarR family transcriptional regulator